MKLLCFYHSKSVNVRISVCDRESPPGLEISTYRKIEDISSSKISYCMHKTHIFVPASCQLKFIFCARWIPGNKVVIEERRIYFSYFEIFVLFSVVTLKPY